MVSEYIDNPLLFNGFKFDLRIYIAVTSVNPLRLYIYEDGLTRFATCKYDTAAAEGGPKKARKFMHLTNFSVNKKNVNFVKNDNAEEDRSGSKWSLKALRQAFKEQGIDDKGIWRKIEDVCIKTVISAEPYMFSAMNSNVPYRDSCFELLGFDILIDSALEPWLIEVNLSCSLGCDSALDQRVKAACVADLFTLIGITPLDKRKTGVEAAGFKKPTMGMYYGSVSAAGKMHGLGPTIEMNRAAATKKAYQEMSKGDKTIGPRK